MLKRTVVAVACGLIVVGCNSEPEKLQGEDKKAMETWLNKGIPASQSPGGGGNAPSTPSAVPTDK